MKLVLILLVSFSSFCGPCHVLERLDLERASEVVKDIRQGEIEYRKKFNRYGSLSDLVAEGLINRGMADGTESGYRFRLVVDQSSYQLTVQRELANGEKPATEEISFFLDESGVIRVSVDPLKPADVSSPPID